MRYDIRTGKLIGASKSTQTAPAKAPAPKPQNKVSMDGFMKPKDAALSPLQPKPAAQKPRKAHEPAKHSHSTHQNVQRSKTLKRPGLKKPQKLAPAAILKPATQKPVTPQTPTHVVSKHPEARLHRAKTVDKSSLITKFTRHAQNNAPKLEKRHAALPVAPAPIIPAAVEAVEHAIQHAAHEVSHVAHEVSHAAQSTEKRLEHAVQNASSHLAELPAAAQKKRRTLTTKRNIFAGTVSAMLLFGFFAWQNMPNLEMRLATTRAGFTASLPKYSPAGYGIEGSIKAEANKVEVSYQSRTDDKGFKITQQKSDWNSQTLQSEYITANNKQVNTYPTEGKTVYLYDESSATWVNGGIWYRIEGDAKLTPDQLQRIANSL